MPAETLSVKIETMNPVDHLNRRAVRTLARYSFCVFFLLLGFASSLHSVEFIKNDFDLALTKAKIEEKPILVFFYTEWCGWCKSMDEIVFSDRKLSEYSSKELVSVRVDAEKREGSSLIKKYRVRTYPTIVFLNHKGNEIHRINGFLPPKSLLKMAETVVEIFHASK
jgi:thioredoxin-related protein